MYKRMERAQLFGETPKSISADEYFAWLDKAKQVKNQYLKDEITAAVSYTHLYPFPILKSSLRNMTAPLLSL